MKGPRRVALGLVCLASAGCPQPAQEWSTVSAVAVADMDGDGLPDLVAAKVLRRAPSAGARPGFAAVALQDAAHPGTFLPTRETRLAGDDPRFLVVADLDGDGRIDLVAGASDGVWVILHAPAAGASFLPPRKIASPAGLGPRSAVEAADLDGDGRIDLVAVDLGTYDPALGVAVGGSVSAFLQDPARPCEFLAPVTSPVTDGLQPVAVAVGDLDGDGRPDLAVACAGTPLDGGTAVLAVLLADPLLPGGFQAPRDHAVGIRADGVVLEDLDGDGRLDAAVADWGEQVLVRDELLGLVEANRASVTVLLQDPLAPGDLLPGRDYPRWGSHAGLAVGDLDGDGWPDLVLADAALPVMFQDPARAGSFHQAVQVESGSSLPY